IVPHLGSTKGRRIDVKAIRVRLDVTQEEFAARFGFSAQYACYSEQGRDSREDGHALIFSRSSAPRRQCRRLCRL
ncbi:helix-turn-helix domain-containing protein, partial [Bradyrhizobium sp.]|uniref:helix-turn-helix domain-containing protein n=1 Tax=Bradyrhizobium sp. TaxID=376 RepID=UPI0029032599|nr:hypothetical protein [Bradyrhizobium sp.]